MEKQESRLITVHNMTEEWPRLNKKARSTVVLEEPDVDYVLNAIANSLLKLISPEIKLYIGASFVHPQDQFNRKLGRKNALARLASVSFEVQNVMPSLTKKVHLLLVGIDESLKVRYSIAIKIYKDDRKARIMGVSTEGLE